MNESEPRTSDSVELAELRRENADLRRQGTLLLAATLVISLIVAAFFGLLFRRDGKELEAMQQQYAQVADTNKKEKQVIDAFLTRLVEHSKTHPELALLLAKYGFRPGESAATAPAAPKK